MLNCEAIDPLVTPYVDGRLADVERAAVDQHLSACPPCHSRVAAERAVRELIVARKSALKVHCAPESLHQRCAAAVTHRASLAEPSQPAQTVPPSLGAEPRELWRDAPKRGTRDAGSPALQRPGWRTRFAPLAAAASLILIVGVAFLYQLTQSSSRVMAAELTADHVKCFALNGLLHTHDDAPTVESSMLSSFGWQMHLPAGAAKAGLELVGSRPCLYGEGKIAHIMYRHNGEPVSLFMLPRTARAQELVQVMGHSAAIWCANNRTFVLLAHEPRAEVERIATAVQAALK